jgi:hypothetical protein
MPTCILPYFSQRLDDVVSRIKTGLHTKMNCLVEETDHVLRGSFIEYLAACLGQCD